MSKQDNTAVTTRVRLARNIRGVPFPGRTSEKQARRVLEMVSQPILETYPNARLFTLEDNNRLEARILVEDHLISPELYAGKGIRAAVLSEDNYLSVMVGEEDHIRIQAMTSGMKLSEALAVAFQMDDLLDGKLPLAFDPKLGYLTACPTNLGTGLRASVMLHLPLLTDNGAIRDIAQTAGKLGLTVRGFYGEGTGASGALYQVSNQLTLGMDEQQIISRVEEFSRRLVKQEKALRRLYQERQAARMHDRVFRSWGILQNARLLSTDEAMNLWSDVRLGVCEEILPPVSIELLDQLLREMQPGHLLRRGGNRPLSPQERDEARAALVRETLSHAAQ